MSWEVGRSYGTYVKKFIGPRVKTPGLRRYGASEWLFCPPQTFKLNDSFTWHAKINISRELILFLAGEDFGKVATGNYQLLLEVFLTGTVRAYAMKKVFGVSPGTSWQKAKKNFFMARGLIFGM